MRRKGGIARVLASEERWRNDDDNDDNDDDVDLAPRRQPRTPGREMAAEQDATSKQNLNVPKVDMIPEKKES